jgi:hypothetical protein
MYTIVTGRFNNETRDANYAYRMKNKFACLYSCPSELSPKILYNTPVFVIEMNNSTNKIEGIGLIKNKPENKKYYKVHSDGNTNRYTFIGNYFIDRETIDDYNSPLVYILEEILFKGKTHSKRGAGLTIIPQKVLKLEVCEGIDIKKEIKEVFIYHFREKLRNDNNDNIIKNIEEN